MPDARKMSILATLHHIIKTQILFDVSPGYCKDGEHDEEEEEEDTTTISVAAKKRKKN